MKTLGAIAARSRLKVEYHEADAEESERPFVEVQFRDSARKLGQHGRGIGITERGGAEPHRGPRAGGGGQTLMGLGDDVLPTMELNGAAAAATSDGDAGLPRSGDVISDRYRVLREIGAGGMGRVYEATHVRLGKAFALKVLNPNVAKQKALRNQFFREAKYASTFNHPNLVSVVDYGDLGGSSAFMVMEYIEGRLMSNFVQERGLPSLRRSCDLVLQIAEGLAYMHDKSVVHCDIKPSNIILAEVPGSRRKLQAKILDFGLARSMGSRKSDNIGGTPEYVSPEAVQKEPPTGASDVYSLGILFYELIVGAPPFTGSMIEVLTAHVHDAPPSLEANAQDKPDSSIVKLIERALAKKVEDRHPTMESFVYELRNAMNMLGYGAKKRRDRSARAAETTNSTGSLPTISYTERVLTPLPGGVSAELRKSLVAGSYDRVPLPLATLDNEGKIVTANRAFAALLGNADFDLEGLILGESALAGPWMQFPDDLAAVSRGECVERRLRYTTDSGQVTRLRLTLEPASVGGFSMLVLYSGE